MNYTLNQIFVNSTKSVNFEIESQGIIEIKLDGNNIKKTYRISRGKKIIKQQSFEHILKSGKIDLYILSDFNGGGSFSIISDNQYVFRKAIGIYEYHSFRWNEKLKKMTKKTRMIRITDSMQEHNTKAIEKRSFYLDYVAKIDTELDELLSNYFLRKLDDFDLWLQMTDQTRMSLSDKTIILSKILKYRFSSYKNRKELLRKFSGVISLRNRFAHSMQMLTLLDDVQNNKFRLRDYDEKTGKMIENDVTFPQVREQIDALLFIQLELNKIDKLFTADRIKTI